MIIDRHLSPYVVFSDETLLAALQKMNANKARIVFCVSRHGHLEGVLSDGDFRRWVTAGTTTDLAVPVREAANPRPVSVTEDQSADEVAALLEPGRIDHVPVLDARGHLVGVASARSLELHIGTRAVGPGNPALLIAEIGNNHNGSVELAMRLVDRAADAGADVAKFQLRDLEALYRGEGTSGHGEDLGAQYTLDLLARFSLGRDDLFRVFDHCARRELTVMCTPWDIPSLRALAEYGVPALKIASADLTNHELLHEAVAARLPLVVSTGMATEAEIRESVDLLRASGTAFALLHCQSTYPAPFKDVNLRYMQRLAEIGDCPVGYSGHERGYHVPLAAVALGAHVIEKHFTLDRGMEGNDHRVSLLPDEFAAMVMRTRELEAALGTAAPREVSTGEMMNRINLAKSVVATRPLEPGHVITPADIEVRSPGRGLQPNRARQLLGRTLRRPLGAGDFFFATDLADEVVRGRDYSFRRPWGLPVRYHDLTSLLEQSTPDFLEFHFSYKDLEVDVDSVLHGRLPVGFTTHLPDLFSGDFLVDLASPEPDVWERSIAEVQRTIDITRRLTQYFTLDDDPVMVVTMGGFTKDAHVAPPEREPLYARIAQALSRLDASGVRLTAQTLPPFPWLMGGQRYHNLFLDPADTAEFCLAHDQRLTLDISHTRLAATFLGVPFSEAVETLAPHTEHLHLVDAVGVDGEGVQVGEGDVDWPVLAEQLDRLAPRASFIPEIWQGHVNNGEGFWLALDRLEKWF